ncbi:glycosyltransferase family 2 protein [Povalibacter sp.]|uniref:glycosyltransferase family 2 protein n=1 Tax=Povalibacter sp. TaxID=1962978 RepID=UPI002F41079A
MTTIATPLVTVVTPFYNSEEYLAECIESVLAQTYQNWEYVLLDNCSTDRSGEIAQQYADRDPRIRFIKATEFVGQVPNYNRALRQLSDDSKYCKMVQADDWILPDCLEKMVACAESDPKVAVVGAYSLYGEQLGHVSTPFRKSGIFDGKEAVYLYLKNPEGFLGSPTCVLYRSSEVRRRDPFFIEDSPCEDVDACFEIFREHSFGFIYQILSFNRRDNDSLWARIRSYRPTVMHRVYLLHRYGKGILTKAQFSELQQVAENALYRVLGEARLTPSYQKLLSFYQQSLALAGVHLNPWRIWTKTAKHGLKTFGNPASTLPALIRRD